MDAKDFNTSYVFKTSKRHNPKSPHDWLVKKVKPKGVDNYIVLKPWQIEAYLTLKESIRGFIKAFCGSGKTIAARSIGAYKAKKYGLTQVYCVPRTDIGLDGFGGFCNIQVPTDNGYEIIKCNTPLNFCKATKEKIQGLIDIMTNEPDHDSGDNVSAYKQIVVTHQCLSLAIKKLKKKNPKLLRKFFENKTWWIDECHHVKGSRKNQQKIIRNHLGDFISYIFENQDLNSEIFIMTATPYRADHGCIVSEEQAASFTTYSLDFLRHFNTLGINKVDMNLEEYKNKSDLFNRLADNLRKEIKTNKHFVFVPPTGKKWRAKKEDVYTLFDIIYTVVMQEYNVTFEVAKSMVLDLVTERTQRRNDKLLRQEPKSGQSHASKYAVVVACMKCREGSDWCPGDRLHNTSMEKSPPLNFQTNGRLFRQFPGKDNVKIYYYVKEFLTQNKTKREFVSDTVNAMLYYMLMDDLFNPIMVEIPHFAPKNKNEKVSKKKSKTTLADHFGLNYFEAKRVLLKSFEDCSLNDQNAERIISKVINKYLPNKDSYDKKHITEIKNAWKVFLIRVASKNMRDKSVDISYVRKNGFDTIVEKEGISGNIFTSHLTPAEMQRFRQISRLKKWDNETLDKEIEYLFKFAEKQLNRKLLNSRVVKDTKNPDKEALEIIKNEHENFKSFNDKVNDIAKQKEVFSVQEIASALAVSENELKARINRWKTFLPSNWKDDLLDKSWSCF
jgi:superfamily II DNA or RNA helicase